MVAFIAQPQGVLLRNQKPQKLSWFQALFIASMDSLNGSDGCKKFKVGDDMGLARPSMQEDETSSDGEPQDADYARLLCDDIALQILARVPISKYSDLCFVNKHFLSLLRSGDLKKIRREIGASEPREPLVYLLVHGEFHWWALDLKSRSRQKLPFLPASMCFANGDKETLCVKTQLLVSGNEIDGLTIWRYELVTDKWYKGPSMITPRCLFASANCGNYACVAGGIGGNWPNLEISDSAEKYNPESMSWEPLPRMNVRRKLCSGCYMDDKFYVVGGQNEVQDENGETRIHDLTCGEFYDAERNTWELIPAMISGASTPISRSPPLLAVVNNELYALEASTNRLRVYLKSSNSWKDLGDVPVRADQSRGWGVAFKSLGDKLLLIGGSTDASLNSHGQGMKIYTCSPDPAAEFCSWQVLEIPVNCMNPFVFNCSVMIA